MDYIIIIIIVSIVLALAVLVIWTMPDRPEQGTDAETSDDSEQCKHEDEPCDSGESDKPINPIPKENSMNPEQPVYIDSRANGFKELHVGALVYHKTGGPVMSVCSLDANVAECRFWDSDGQRFVVVSCDTREILSADGLKEAEPIPPRGAEQAEKGEASKTAMPSVYGPVAQERLQALFDTENRSDELFNNLDAIGFFAVWHKYSDGLEWEEWLAKRINESALVPPARLEAFEATSNDHNAARQKLCGSFGVKEEDIGLTPWWEVVFERYSKGAARRINEVAVANDANRKAKDFICRCLGLNQVGDTYNGKPWWEWAAEEIGKVRKVQTEIDADTITILTSNHKDLLNVRTCAAAANYAIRRALCLDAVMPDLSKEWTAPIGETIKSLMQSRKHTKEGLLALCNELGVSTDDFPSCKPWAKPILEAIRKLKVGKPSCICTTIEQCVLIADTWDSLGEMMRGRQLYGWQIGGSEQFNVIDRRPKPIHSLVFRVKAGKEWTGKESLKVDPMTAMKGLAPVPQQQAVLVAVNKKWLDELIDRRRKDGWQLGDFGKLNITVDIPGAYHCALMFRPADSATPIQGQESGSIDNRKGETGKEPLKVDPMTDMKGICGPTKEAIIPKETPEDRERTEKADNRMGGYSSWSENEGEKQGDSH